MDKVPMWILKLDAPQLQSLSITAITPTHHGQFNRLKELHVKDSGYFVQSRGDNGSMGTLVAHFSELQTLSITASPLPGPSLPVHPTDTHIVSFTLSDLRMADIPRGTLTDFLSALRMPFLQSLTIEGLFGYLWDEFVYWLADAHYPALRCVTFEAVELVGLNARFFRSFTSISTLRLLDIGPEPIVRILESNPLICPALRRIDVWTNGRISCVRC
jgi:hypothetical protein